MRRRPRPPGVDRRCSLLDDPDGFSDFYEAHAERVLVWFTRRVYEPEVALDLTAETFAEAYTARARFRGSTIQEAGGWLFAIARHVFAHYVRRGEAERRAVDRLGIRMPTVSEEEQEEIVSRSGLPELRALVAEQLRALTADQREALRLRVVEELPYPDVAEQLGISEPTARARVSRGLKALAAALDRADKGGALL